jgi:hypothetical protein
MFVDVFNVTQLGTLGEWMPVLGQKLKGTVAVEASWNVMAHVQKSDFVFPRNGRVHLNRRERQFSRLLAAEVCGSAVVMLDTPCSEVVWRVLDTHYIRQFPLHFPSRASPFAITFQTQSKPHITEGSIILRKVDIRRLNEQLLEEKSPESYKVLVG